MKLVVYPVLDDVRDVLRRGTLHPQLGAFVDIGSYGCVNAVTAGPPGMDELLGDEFARACAAQSQPNGISGCPISIHPAAETVDAIRSSENEWHSLLTGGNVVALLILDLPGSHAPLWVLAGNHLPVMGLMEPCTREDLWNTWLTLAGATVLNGRFLLEEPEITDDSVHEQALVARMRELYGD